VSRLTDLIAQAKANFPVVNADACTWRSPLSPAATCCCSTNPPTTSMWKPCARLKMRCSNSPAASPSSPTTAGSSTASPPTSSRRKAIPSGRSSTATIRNMRRTRRSGSARKVRSRSGFGISRLAGRIRFPIKFPLRNQERVEKCMKQFATQSHFLKK